MNKEIKETISIDKRWEEGIEHDARSMEIMDFLKDYDFKFCNDFFCWKTGGDGDNGELLMYQLDEFFESAGAGYRKQEPIIIPTPIESGCAMPCDTKRVALNEFADKIIDLINSKADDFVVKDTYTKGKINGLRTAKMLIDELKKEYGVE